MSKPYDPLVSTRILQSCLKRNRIFLLLKDYHKLFTSENFYRLNWQISIYSSVNYFVYHHHHRIAIQNRYHFHANYQVGFRSLKLDK